MRARLACLCVLAAAGCTRENPAFNVVDTEAETSAGTDTEPAETGDGNGEEAPDPACELEGGTNLDIQMAQICGADPFVYDKWLLVSGFNGASTWVVNSCLAGCTNCEDMVGLNLKFGPLPVDELAGPGACLHVLGRRREPGDINSCNFQTAVVWEVDDGGHDLVLVARGATDVELPAPEGNSAPGTPDFNVTPVSADSCPCDEFPGACCETIAPTTFEFDIGGPDTIPIGEVVPVNVGGRPMNFHALNAFLTGECMDDLPHVSWALTRPPP